MSERIVARYFVETAYPLEAAAAAMAGEQSSGTFRATPGETPELLRLYGARVERIAEIGEVAAPSLPGARGPNGGGPIRQAEVTLSWSLANTGLSLPTVWSTVLGNLFELHHLSALRLLDIDFPAAFASAYPGPAFAVAGTRRMTGVEGAR